MCRSHVCPAGYGQYTRAFEKLGMLLPWHTVGSIPLHRDAHCGIQPEVLGIVVQDFSTESTFSTPAGYTPYNINYKVTCNS